MSKTPQGRNQSIPLQAREQKLSRRDLVSVLGAGGMAVAVTGCTGDSPGMRGAVTVHPQALIGGSTSAAESMAELEVLVPDSPGDPTWYTLLGYYEEGDGGGGVFYWDADSSGGNGGTIIQHPLPAERPSVGRWVRAFSGAVNVRWFGARGDSADNDVDTLAIQDALNTGEPVHIPPGDYRIRDTLQITTTFQQLTGHESGTNRLSNLVWDGPAGLPLLWVQQQGASLHGLWFSRQNEVKDWTAIRFRKTNTNEDDVDARIQQCRFSHFEIAVDFFGRGLKLTDNTFVKGKTAVELTYLEETTNSGEEMHTPAFGFRGFTLSGNRVHSCTKFLIARAAESGASTPLYGLVMQGNLMDIGRAFFTLWVPVRHCSITNNVINHCTSDVFTFVKPCMNTVISNNVISGSRATGSTPSKTAINFWSEATVEDTTISGNSFGHLGRQALLFQGECHYVSISGNAFDDIGFEPSYSNRGAIVFGARSGDVVICGNTFKMNTAALSPIRTTTGSVVLSGFEVATNAFERDRALFSDDFSEPNPTHNSIQGLG